MKHMGHKCPYCHKIAYVTKVNMQGNTIHSELKCFNCGAIFGHYTILKGGTAGGRR